MSPPQPSKDDACTLSNARKPFVVCSRNYLELMPPNILPRAFPSGCDVELPRDAPLSPRHCPGTSRALSACDIRPGLGIFSTGRSPPRTAAAQKLSLLSLSIAIPRAFALSRTFVTRPPIARVKGWFEFITEAVLASTGCVVYCIIHWEYCTWKISLCKCSLLYYCIIIESSVLGKLGIEVFSSKIYNRPPRSREWKGGLNLSLRLYSYRQAVYFIIH